MDNDAIVFGVVSALVARYGWLFIGINMFWPVYRDFVQGMMMGLLFP